MTTSRQTVRTGLATLLATELVGSGLPVQAVYSYLVGDFGGQSPVVVVASSGTKRKALTKSAQAGTMLLDVFVFVLYSDGASWSEEDAEASLDEIEELTASVIRANRTTDAWSFIDYDDRSRTDSVVIGGLNYRRERITVAVEVL